MKMVLFLVPAALCAVAEAGPRMFFSQTNPNGVYSRSDVVTFTADIRDDGKPLYGAKIKWSLRLNETQTTCGVHKVGDVPLAVAGRFSKTGDWLRLTLDGVDARGGKLRHSYADNATRQMSFSIGAVAEPLKIRLHEKPDDFEAFWAKERERLAAVPVNPRVRRVSADELGAGYSDKCDYFDITLDSVDGVACRGMMAVRKDAAHGSQAMRVCFQGAGIHVARPSKLEGENMIHVVFNACGIENLEKPEYYASVRKRLHSYWSLDSHDRDCYFMKGVILRVLRAMEYVKTIPQWNRRDLSVWGCSQGGMQALVAAAFDRPPCITSCFAAVCAMCDVNGPEEGRLPGWPGIYRRRAGDVWRLGNPGDGKKGFEKLGFEPPDFKKVPWHWKWDESIVKTAGYFDVGHFCPRIRCPIEIVTGLSDTTCPPTSVIAAYNAIPAGKKRLLVNPECGHAGYQYLYGQSSCVVYDGEKDVTGMPGVTIDGGKYYPTCGNYGAKGASARELRVSPRGLTPHAALAKIREAKKSGDASAWTVRVGSGIYEFGEPLVFLPEDSGTPEAPVKWIGEGRAVFSGGKVLSGWRDDGDGVWSAPIPRRKDGKAVYFESFYVNGRRADRAKLPEKGGYRLSKWQEEKVVFGGVTNFVNTFVIAGEKPDFLASLSREELETAQWRVFIKWSYGSYPIDFYDSATGVMKVSGRFGVPSYKSWIGDETHYFYLENVAPGFKKPGQWFYDVKAGRVKYRPLEGETIASLEAVAPVAGLVSLVEFKGDVEKGDFVRDISFENISFTASRTDGDLQDNGFVKQYLLQAACSTGATIRGEGMHRIRFERCKVFNTENYAFRFEEGCVSNVVVSCEITDAGAGGIWIGGKQTNPFKMANPKWRHLRNVWRFPMPAKKLVDTSARAVRFNVVDDNLITRCGRVNPEGCGIVLTHAADTKVTHNEISDLYYTGISVGFTWGYWGSYAQRNEISFNRITDIGQHRMADMGGIYTLGTSFGTVITNNVIMNVDSISYGGWGMYNDEGSEGIRWENNLVVNTSADSYHLHFGRSNEVVNCVMVNGGTSKLCVSREEKHRQVRFERNIVYWPEGPVYVRWGMNRLRDGTADVEWKDNFFWCASGVTELNGPTAGFAADPLFENPEKGDWRIKKNSPVLKAGFRAWDYSLSGRRGK